MKLCGFRRQHTPIAGVDVFASLALVAERSNYVKPAINEKGVHRY